MSRRTHHSQSHIYVAEVLDITEPCPRRNCEGTLTVVWVRYKPNGPIKIEKECSTCSKVYREHRRKSSRQRENKQLPSN